MQPNLVSSEINYSGGNDKDKAKLVEFVEVNTEAVDVKTQYCHMKIKKP